MTTSTSARCFFREHGSRTDRGASQDSLSVAWSGQRDPGHVSPDRQKWGPMANQTAALRTLSRPLLPVGDLFAFAVDVLRAVFVRPFQWREFFDQAWFVT